jgi:predicted DNA-binding protein with PD1-like motif
MVSSLQAKRKTKLRLTSIKPSGEVFSSASEQVGNLGIKNAAVVSLIGAADSCGVVSMPGNDSTKDICTEYDIPAQRTGTGEIIGGQAHIHWLLTGEDHTGFGGHLLWTRVGTWFVNAYIIAMDGGETSFPRVLEGMRIGRVSPAEGSRSAGQYTA